MKNIDKRIEEIDRKLVELDSYEVVNKKHNKNSKSEKNELKDRTKETIEIIRECVNELLNIDDLKKSREENEELFENFSRLGLDEKRNKYSEEMIKVALLLKTSLNQENLELVDMPYNYKSVEDKKLTESDLLNINFRDLHILKTERLK